MAAHRGKTASRSGETTPQSDGAAAEVAGR